jgi:hypothetical protein
MPNEHRMFVTAPERLETGEERARASDAAVAAGVSHAADAKAVDERALASGCSAGPRGTCDLPGTTRLREIRALGRSVVMSRGAAIVATIRFPREPRADAQFMLHLCNASWKDLANRPNTRERRLA